MDAHAPDLMDNDSRLVPNYVLITRHEGCPLLARVIGHVVYGPGQRPVDCPIKADWVAVEIKTWYGSRWWGFRMATVLADGTCIVSGFPAADEVRSHWERTPQIS